MGTENEDDEPEPVHIGVEFHVHPDVADDFRKQFHAAVEDLLADYDDSEIFDYGVD